jgi:hypothetical protein
MVGAAGSWMWVQVDTPEWIQDVEPRYTSVNVQLTFIALWTPHYFKKGLA